MTVELTTADRQENQRTARIHNFNPGPAALPLPVLERVQAELLDYRGSGLSILEASHRAREYEEINAQAETRMKSLLGLGDGYRVLFLQGGASLQFAMLPMNFLPQGRTADYILTGTWSEKARDEAASLGQIHVAASTQEEQYRRIPRQEEIRLSAAPAYVHYTSNNTIWGTQWHYVPDAGGAPLVADMSSDILSRPIDAERYTLIYAGAQKNTGPAGVTAVISRADWLETAPKTVPTILRYATHARANSLYNTPPVFAVYMLNLVLEWVEGNGGLTGMQVRNERKAKLIYDAIDSSNGYYRGHAESGSRSLMNATFRLPTEEEEQRFVREATEAGLIGLAGHRSVGGVRVSMYNAVTLESCQALADFMAEFTHRNG